MADEHFLANFVKRNSLQPMNFYEEPPTGSQLFIPKASRPSLEPGVNLNLPLSRNMTCHSPRSMTWSDDLIKKKRTRISDLPGLPQMGLPPKYDRADNFSQLWINPTNMAIENAVVDIGVIINQDNEDRAETGVCGDFPFFLRPYSSLGEVNSKKSNTSIQNVFLGPPHAHFDTSRRSLSSSVLPSLHNVGSISSVHLTGAKSNLELIILKIFYREKILESDLNLSSRDYNILNSIFQRKFLKAVDLEPLQTDKDNLIRVIENLTSFSSSKRPEECHKFVLSKTFKFLRKTFKPTVNTEPDDTTEFYEFYFGDASAKLKVDISAFHFPSKSKIVKNPNSFNGEYFAKLFASQRFVAALREYMTSMIFTDHRDEIKKKIEKIIDKWNKMLEKSGQPVDKTLALIKNEVVKNKKFKLPWTFSELHEAIFRVNELIEVIASK